MAEHRDAAAIAAPRTADWPFLHPLTPPLPPRPVVVRMTDLDEAFINRQTGSTRLVTTQALFLLQIWLDRFADRDDVLLVGTADRDALHEHAAELLTRRGPFASTTIDEIAASEGEKTDGAARDRADGDQGQLALLRRAMRTSDPAERLTLCVAALDRGRHAPALLAAASTCMEVGDLDAAARDLDEAIAQAPDWPAVHFEHGKLRLRRDEMERAQAAFAEAARLMPSFGSAWANLGATLGELDRPQEALAAFEQARGCDPQSAQVWNNIGVVHRELGQLAESEAAFHKVIELSPSLAFGYYNLGHTLFLQGRYQAALSAYGEGQRRDPERNPVQATRLALCRLATGDWRGALADLQRSVATLPTDYKRQVLADTHAVAWALLTHRPDLAGFHEINDWLTRELAR